MRPRFNPLTLAATAGNIVGQMANNTSSDLTVLYGEIVLAADATVGNRFVELGVYDAAGAEFHDVHAGAAVTAGLTTHLQFMVGTYRETAIANGALQVPMPAELVLPAGGTLRVTVTGGLAGDSYTAKFMAKEAVA